MTGAAWLKLSPLDARVLRATDARYERSPETVGELAGCAPDVVLSTLRRLRVRELVEDDGSARSGGCAPTAATWRWSTSCERGPAPSDRRSASCAYR